MIIVTATCTDIGKREIQQDSYGHIHDKDISALLVTDGNGGKGGWEIAKAVVNTVSKYLSHKTLLNLCRRIETKCQLKSLGTVVLIKAAAHVKRLKESNQDWNNAGTTATLVIVTPNHVGCFWIGDSSAYKYQAGDLMKLTSPIHTLAEEMIKNGESKEILEKQPYLNSILTRCVGHESHTPDSKIVDTTKPFLLIVGTDGAFGFLSEVELKQIIQSKLTADFNVQVIADEIVKRSLEQGSDDNVTVVVSLVLPSHKAKKINKRTTKMHDWTI
jgi:PPM family protein phosphatase